VEVRNPTRALSTLQPALLLLACDGIAAGPPDWPWRCCSRSLVVDAASAGRTLAEGEDAPPGRRASAPQHSCRVAEELDDLALSAAGAVEDLEAVDLAHEVGPADVALLLDGLGKQGVGVLREDAKLVVMGVEGSMGLGAVGVLAPRTDEEASVGIVGGEDPEVGKVVRARGRHEGSEPAQEGDGVSSRPAVPSARMPSQPPRASQSWSAPRFWPFFSSTRAKMRGLRPSLDFGSLFL
jgi:hypothetical protein